MMMVFKTINECSKILRKFHDKQPNIRQVFHSEIRETIRRDRILVAPNGRRRDFFGRVQDESTINEGISFLPQAIVTDYMKAALPAVQQLCFNMGQYPGTVWRPLSEAHDGFLAEVKQGWEEEYGRIFKRTVQVPIDFSTCSLKRDFKLIIPCEVEVSKTNWEEMKGLKV